MPLRAVLLVSISLIQEGKINYVALAELVVATLLLGFCLWQVGFDLVDGRSKLRKASGVVILALAALYSLGALWLWKWELAELFDMLG
ncbi:MAG: hypothetical protein ACRYG7_55300 [Janthinobacterium lividum]